MLRVFLQAKSHPFFGEETIDPYSDLYRGKVFPLFRCVPTGFNFMPVICLDYIYRDLYQSNITTVIERANQLFYQTRQRLDLLCVLECNPNPSTGPSATWSTASTASIWPTPRGYATPPRSSATVRGRPVASATPGRRLRLLDGNPPPQPQDRPAETGEFRTDDFDGLPVCRLRFGTETRLYYFNLPLFHELDPRTTRYPLKIHAIYRPDDGGWVRLVELTPELSRHRPRFPGGAPARCR